MNAEEQVLRLTGQYCLAKLDEMIDAVAALDDETANAVPEVEGANSAYQLLTHCLGMQQQWVQRHCLGLQVERDRDAEFLASGPVGDLVTRAREVRNQLEIDLATLRPGAPAEPRPSFEDEFWAGSVEGILLHVFEELCQHLGHLEVTRDLVTARTDA